MKGSKERIGPTSPLFVQWAPSRIEDIETPPIQAAVDPEFLSNGGRQMDN